MSYRFSDFVHRCIQGEASLDEIDDAVDEWHSGQSSDSLAQFLGMTGDEYSSWVVNPDALRFIIESRRIALGRGEPRRVSP